jgi:transposase-like protein
MADKEQKRRGPYQRHSRFIRLQVAKQYHEGTRTLRELSEEYGIANQSISRWVKSYRNDQLKRMDCILSIDMTAEEQKNYEELRQQNELLKQQLTHSGQELKDENEVLRKELEQARMQAKAMEAIIDLASSELGIDLRKNSGARQPARSDKATRRQK